MSVLVGQLVLRTFELEVYAVEELFVIVNMFLVEFVPSLLSSIIHTRFNSLRRVVPCLKRMTAGKHRSRCHQPG